MARKRAEDTFQRVIAAQKAQIDELIREVSRLRVKLRQYEPEGEPCEPPSAECSA